MVAGGERSLHPFAVIVCKKESVDDETTADSQLHHTLETQLIEMPEGTLSLPWPFLDKRTYSISVQESLFKNPVLF